MRYSNFRRIRKKMVPDSHHDAVDYNSPPNMADLVALVPSLNGLL